MPTLLLDHVTVESLLDIRRVMDLVERAFIAHARHEDRMPSKVYLELPQYGSDFRAMPAYVLGAAGIKWVSTQPRNPSEQQLPNVLGVVIYNDPITGYPRAIMDGTAITRYRTGSAAGIATKLLAREDYCTLGIVGCGVQAYTVLLAHLANHRPETVILADQRREAAEELIRVFPEVPCRYGSLEEAAGCDVVCTLTPTTKPLIRREWVRPGTHINALGADAPGKQELDFDLLLAARVFVDDLEQASHAGEINVAIHEGVFRLDQIVGTIGEVAAGMKPGRVDAEDITIFDSTGLAIQDIATARDLFEEARRREAGQWVNLVGEG